MDKVDINKTFALVAKFITIICILTLRAAMDWEIHQMDINATFFNGDFQRSTRGFHIREEGTRCVQIQ